VSGVLKLSSEVSECKPLSGTTAGPTAEAALRGAGDGIVRQLAQRHLGAGAYTRPLLSSTSDVSATKVYPKHSLTPLDIP